MIQFVLNERRATKWETNSYSSLPQRKECLFFPLIKNEDWQRFFFDQTLARILNLFLGPSCALPWLLGQFNQYLPTLDVITSPSLRCYLITLACLWQESLSSRTPWFLLVTFHLLIPTPLHGSKFPFEHVVFRIELSCVLRTLSPYCNSPE